MIRGVTLPEEQEFKCRREGCINTFIKSVHNKAFCSPECTKEYTNKKILQQYHDRKNRDFKGRVCNRDGCDTILSIYNHDDVCGVHQQQEFVTRLREWGWEEIEDDYTL